jgi:hypothetical protein
MLDTRLVLCMFMLCVFVAVTNGKSWLNETTSKQNVTAVKQQEKKKSLTVTKYVFPGWVTSIQKTGQC